MAAGVAGSQRVAGPSCSPCSPGPVPLRGLSGLPHSMAPRNSQTMYTVAQGSSRNVPVNEAEAASHLMAWPWESCSVTSAVHPQPQIQLGEHRPCLFMRRVSELHCKKSQREGKCVWKSSLPLLLELDESKHRNHLEQASRISGSCVHGQKSG